MTASPTTAAGGTVPAARPAADARPAATLPEKPALTAFATAA